MARARVREVDGYVERHHIKPRCLGGSDRSSNIVKLTYREHFLAHWLLTKIHKGEAGRKCRYSFRSFFRRKRRLRHWQLRILIKISHNCSHSKSTKSKMSASRIGNTNTKGHKLSEAHKKKISKHLWGNTHTKGQKISKDHIAALRAGHKRYWENKRV